MSFAGTWAAIRRMIRETALKTNVAHDIARKAGIRMGTVATLETGGVSVLSAGIATYESQTETLEPVGGFVNNFVWPGVPDEFLWWPENANYGRYETVTDLTNCTRLRNNWHIHPSGNNPDVNIRVQASLDGVTWEYATLEYLDPFEWRFAGANVNGSDWFTYTFDDVPYTNYLANTAAREGVTNAFPGGLTTSGWHTIRPEFRVEGVHLRWKMDFSHLYDEDPIYTSITRLIAGYGDVQVS